MTEQGESAFQQVRATIEVGTLQARSAHYRQVVSGIGVLSLSEVFGLTMELEGRLTDASQFLTAIEQDGVQSVQSSILAAEALNEAVGQSTQADASLALAAAQAAVETGPEVILHVLSMHSAIRQALRQLRGISNTLADYTLLREAALEAGIVSAQLNQTAITCAEEYVAKIS